MENFKVGDIIIYDKIATEFCNIATFPLGTHCPHASGGVPVPGVPHVPSENCPHASGGVPSNIDSQYSHIYNQKALPEVTKAHGIEGIGRKTDASESYGTYIIDLIKMESYSGSGFEGEARMVEE